MANVRDYKHVHGVGQLTDALRALREDMQNKIIGDATRAALQPVLVASRRLAKRSEDTGALRASLTIKVKVYPHSKKAVGLMGPDRSYYRKGKKTGKLGALFADRRPANYAHLIEYGHHQTRGKKGTSLRKKTAVAVSWVPAKPFIRPAVIMTKGEQAAAFTEGIHKGIVRTCKKHAKQVS